MRQSGLLVFEVVMTEPGFEFIIAVQIAVFIVKFARNYLGIEPD